jgi:DNA-binding transcriptional MerR regulator
MTDLFSQSFSERQPIAAKAGGATSSLPPIPAKRYFTIGEVSDLCGVKAHVLRYWEQEFTQLKPLKRRGNRRYYQHHEVLLVRRIRELLYEQGYTIHGARNQLSHPSGATANTTSSAHSGFPESMPSGSPGDLVGSLKEIIELLRY